MQKKHQLYVEELLVVGAALFLSREELLLLLLMVGVGITLLLPGVTCTHLAQIPLSWHLRFVLILSAALPGALSQSCSSSGQYNFR